MGEFCRKCESRFEVHLHHIIPKNIGGIDKDGRIYFCKKHHDMIHFIMPEWIWKFVVNKKEAKKYIWEQTKIYSQDKIRRGFKI